MKNFHRHKKLKIEDFLLGYDKIIVEKDIKKLTNNLLNIN